MKVWGNTWNIPYYFCEDHYEEIQDRSDSWSAESFAAEVCSCTAEYCDYTGKCLDCGGDTYHSIIEVCHDCGEYNAESFGAESYADFFTQMEELLESTTIAGGWTLDATTDQEDPDAVTMVVKFKPTDPSTFFDIIE